MAFFGIPMVGPDMCGFEGETTEELCARWVATSAFQPFSRSHNAIHMPSQELYRWESVAATARVAFGVRYQLLPYLYTLFHSAHSTGSLVSRPLWADYPTLDPAHNGSFESQFMIGDGILVAPVVEEGARTLDVWFPPGFWWNLPNLPLLSASDTVNTVYSGDKNDGDGDIRNVNAPLGSIQIWGKAGTILPLHAPLPINDENSSVSLTTTTARTLPYTLLVLLPSANATDATASATDFTVNGNAPARGLLFLDEENNDPNNNPSDDQSKNQAKNQANRLSQQHEKKKENSQKVQSGDLIIRFEANS